MLRSQLRNLRKTTGGGGWIFRDAQFLWARVDIDPVATKSRLPFGMRVSSPATGIVFFAHYPETTFGSVYSEAGLLIPVRHRFSDAVHCPWMLVDDDIALIAGRELLGYPKKLGSFELSFGASEFRGSVHRHGEPVLRMSAKLGAVDPNPPPLLGQRVVNVRGLLGLGPQQLVAFEPKEQILDARWADARVQVTGTERDPLDGFGIGKVVDAHYYRVNIGAGRLPLPLRPVSPLFGLRNWALRYS